MFASYSEDPIKAASPTILMDRFKNNRKGADWFEDKDLGWCEYPWKWEGDDPKVKEQHARIRIWKLLRELNVPPVFLANLEDELFLLLSKAAK